jgi:hypothetical protein
MVQRMLGDIMPEVFYDLVKDDLKKYYDIITKIDTIGTQFDGTDTDIVSGTCFRMMYYARKIISQNPTSIIEVGGGVGEFYAIIKAMGWDGEYYIYDLDDVRKFQFLYLNEVERQTGLLLRQTWPHLIEDPFFVSFYALGEMTDSWKEYYIESVVKACRHGFVIWNPHSGASSEIPFECKVEDEYPLTHPGNKMLTW